MNHKCPIDSCTHQLPHHILMCSRHWGMVPPSLKRAVYATWNRGNPTPDYLATRAEAVRSVNLVLGGNSK